MYPPSGQGFELQLALGVGEGRFQAAGEGLVLGKGRVNADEVNAFVVQPPQEVQVVGDEEVAVEGVLHTSPPRVGNSVYIGYLKVG